MSEQKTTVVKKKAAAETAAPVVKEAEKAAVKSVTKKTPVVDLITQESNIIEKLTKSKAFETIENLINDTDFNLFKIGGVLAVIQDNGWFIDEGYESLKDFVEAKHGMKYRKAMYSIQIYKSLVESGVQWEQVKSIGWSKLRMIAEVLTLENVDDYVKLAADMTQTQLWDYVKEQKKGTLETGATAAASVNESAVAESKKLSTMTFKVHADQKEVIVEAIEQAKNDADTEFDTVALEALCLNYLNGGAAKTTKKDKPVVKGFATLKDAMAAHSYEDVLNIFSELWPEVELAVMTDEEEGEEGAPFEEDGEFSEDFEEEI